MKNVKCAVLGVSDIYIYIYIYIYGDNDIEYCYQATPDIKDVPGFFIPPDSGALTGEGWQLMHEVKADPSDSMLAAKVQMLGHTVS